MPRSQLKQLSSPASAYGFHLINDRGATGIPGAVVGAVVSGPVGTLFQEGFDNVFPVHPVQVATPTPLTGPTAKKTSKTKRKRAVRSGRGRQKS